MSASPFSRLVRVFAYATMMISGAWPSTARAEENPIGIWNLKIDANGKKIEGTKISISKNDDGGLAGKFIGTIGGEVKLEGLKATAGKLNFSFMEKPELEYSKMTFDGKIDGDYFTGTFASEGGSMPVEGTRAGASGTKPAGVAASKSGVSPAGHWDVKIDTNGRRVETALDISAKPGGKFVAGWSTPKGDVLFEDVKYEKGNLTFSRKMIEEGEEFEIGFDGRVEGDKLRGKFKLHGGDRDVEGVRTGESKLVPNPGNAPKSEKPAPPPGPSLAERAALVGAWDITSVSQLGTLQRKLTINENLTGLYETDDSRYFIKNLKLMKGGDVTFNVTIEVDGADLALQFKGKVEVDKLTGEFTSDQGNAKITGKKLSASPR